MHLRIIVKKGTFTSGGRELVRVSSTNSAVVVTKTLID